MRLKRVFYAAIERFSCRGSTVPEYILDIAGGQSERVINPRHDGYMIPIPAQTRFLRAGRELVAEKTNHCIRIAEMAQINGKIVTTGRRCFIVKQGQFFWADRFQMQWPMVFHSDGEDKNRLTRLFDDGQNHPCDGQVADIGAEAILVVKRPNIDKFIDPPFFEYSFALVKRRGIPVRMSMPYRWPCSVHEDRRSRRAGWRRY